MQQELDQVTAIYNSLINFIVNYSFQIVGAIFIMLVGVLIARKVSHIVLGLCLKRNLDVTLSSFIASAIRITIIVMISIMALSKVGISITPLLATIGAISLGAGLAVQGLVSNYGAGLNIIFTRPFVVGDTIEVHHVKGIVKEVHLSYTLLTDEDNVQINVPNRHIVGEVIKNSQKDSLLELSIGVSYKQNPDVAVDTIKAILNQHELINQQRPWQVGIDNFGDSSINIGVRIWAPTDRYYEIRYQINQAIYQGLQQAGVDIPFPQRDVHLHQH